jgi:DtxR family Mn-dependent transcriptional regulator
VIDAEISAAVEDYAKAIFVLQERRGEPVATKDLSSRLDVTPGSVSSMISRLVSFGLVKHAPYRGVKLTPEGVKLAGKVVRKHRVIETFLNARGGIPWDKVHDEAERLEHGFSDEAIEMIYEQMGQPLHDPHGDPIPRTDPTTIPPPDTSSLAELPEGVSGTLARVSDSDPEMLRYLSEHDVEIGNQIEVGPQEPFGGPIKVVVEDRRLALAPELAAAIRIKIDD